MEHKEKTRNRDVSEENTIKSRVAVYTAQSKNPEGKYTARMCDEGIL